MTPTDRRAMQGLLDRPLAELMEEVCQAWVCTPRLLDY
jgi:hypothetical protein